MYLSFSELSMQEVTLNTPALKLFSEMQRKLLLFIKLHSAAGVQFSTTPNFLQLRAAHILTSHTIFSPLHLMVQCQFCIQDGSHPWQIFHTSRKLLFLIGFLVPGHRYSSYCLITTGARWIALEGLQWGACLSPENLS